MFEEHRENIIHGIFLNFPAEIAQENFESPALNNARRFRCTIHMHLSAEIDVEEHETVATALLYGQAQEHLFRLVCEKAASECLYDKVRDAVRGMSRSVLGAVLPERRAEIGVEIDKVTELLENVFRAR